MIEDRDRCFETEALSAIIRQDREPYVGFIETVATKQPADTEADAVCSARDAKRPVTEIGIQAQRPRLDRGPGLFDGADTAVAHVAYEGGIVPDREHHRCVVRRQPAHFEALRIQDWPVHAPFRRTPPLLLPASIPLRRP